MQRPQEVDFWFEEKTKDEDCVDNERWADVSKPEEVVKYLEQQRTGCCGFVDEVVVVDGTLYLVGFNHGH